MPTSVPPDADERPWTPPARPGPRGSRRVRARAVSSALDPVDADHSGHHVRLDVAVIEPCPGVLLRPADAKGLGGADGLRVDVGPERRGPAVAVDVEGVVLGAHGHDV